MKVHDIMIRNVKSCGPETNLAAATEMMWRNNCGALPVLDSESNVIGVLTDRDMCIALGTRNQKASELKVADVAVKPAFTCGPEDDVHQALKTMRQHQVRRIPVVADDSKLAGILCLDEIVLQAVKSEHKINGGISYEDVVNTMKAIYEHRAAKSPKAEAVAVGAASGH